MSAITNNLQEIQAWLNSNYPEAANVIQEGRGQQETGKILERLPFNIAKAPELVALYAWSEGVVEQQRTNDAYVFSPFDTMALINLQDIAETATFLDGEFEEEKVRYTGERLLPIFEVEGHYLCLVENNGGFDQSPLIYVTDIFETSTQYQSLQGMLVTTAECLSQGIASTIQPSLGDEGSLSLIYDQEQAMNIYRKNNKAIPRLVMQRIKNEITNISEKEDFERHKALEDCYGEVLLLRRNWPNISLKTLDSSMLDILTHFVQENAGIDEYLGRQILEEFTGINEDD